MYSNVAPSGPVAITLNIERSSIGDNSDGMTFIKAYIPTPDIKNDDECQPLSFHKSFEHAPILLFNQTKKGSVKL
jgi:hypothetical protein